MKKKSGFLRVTPYTYIILRKNKYSSRYELLNKLEEFEKALLAVDRITAKDVFTQYLNGVNVLKGIQELIAPSLESIGSKWSKGEISLAQVYMSGRITEELVDLILPDTREKKLEQTNLAITTLNDYHFLGKRIVYSILRANGFELMDFGRKEVNELVKSVKDNNIQVLLVSVLMLNSAMKIKELKNKFTEQDIDTQIIVGGAPFRMDLDLWEEVDADASGLNASDSIKLVTDLTGGAI